MSVSLLEKYGIEQDIFSLCETSIDLRKYLGLSAPSERTCRRIMAEWRTKESLTQIDSKKDSNEDTSPTIPKSITELTTDVRYLKQGIYVITCAQNDSIVNEGFLRCLNNYCKSNNAKLIVGGTAYGKISGWDSSIQEYLCFEPIKIGKDLIFCGELSISPTISDPVAALDTYTGEYSGIFAHPQVRLKSLARFDGDPRFHYTTGAITEPNYITATAGYKAIKNHKLGALVVQVDSSGDWFVRQISYDNEWGSFYDLDKEYVYSYVSEGFNALAITWGDVHFPNVAEEFWSVHKDMIRTLYPYYQFIHDVYDFHVRNHHTINDPHRQYKKYINNKDNIFNELLKAAHCINRLTKESKGVHIVRSNHELALEKWLLSDSWKTDYVNAEFYLKAQSIKYKHIKECPDIPFLEYLFQELGISLSKVHFLNHKYGFNIQDNDGKNIQCGFHGNFGLNGSKASVSQFKKTGEKVNIGHSHTACIDGGVFSAGTSTELRLDYNEGLTTWSNSHILVYPDGNRTIITTRGDKWRIV